MKGFPLQNLLPGLLVILIVNFDDIVHISLTNIVILPLPPRKGHLVELDNVTDHVIKSTHIFVSPSHQKPLAHRSRNHKVTLFQSVPLINFF